MRLDEAIGFPLIDTNRVHCSLDYDSTPSTRSRVLGIPTIFNFKYLAWNIQPLRYVNVYYIYM